MLLITMDLADSEGDMANLTKVVEDFLTQLLLVNLKKRQISYVIVTSEHATWEEM